ncbi:hypothetical protein FTO70_03920 [Methanosarcina sp. KYL-1]|uniref:hypothetical protein n=1 Tax=Methanosarcina sp. KYL-1 TaxID=2602068 RepID=UPI002101CDF6|nr:hypothetical protein [Methanosarcina sp. KYL-1]MCQ1534850.1 hypothetical protein [Methanosarcina sp. KYL-1]
MDNLMEKLKELSIYPILAVGLLLICILFVLMFRFAEAESLSMVLITALLISAVSFLIMKVLVHKKLRGEF